MGKKNNRIRSQFIVMIVYNPKIRNMQESRAKFLDFMVLVRNGPEMTISSKIMVIPILEKTRPFKRSCLPVTDQVELGHDRLRPVAPVVVPPVAGGVGSPHHHAAHTHIALGGHSIVG